MKKGQLYMKKEVLQKVRQGEKPTTKEVGESIIISLEGEDTGVEDVEAYTEIVETEKGVKEGYEKIELKIKKS